MTVLSVENLTVRFASTIGVRSVSLDVEPGRITGVLGANGAGKTTTLLGIHARVQRVSGRIVLDGKDVTALNTAQLVRAGIALCPENRRLFPNMSIEDNLLLGAFGARRVVQQRRLAASYERFGWISSRRRELAGRLSGGQQQMVAIARALMSEPKLVLLDEPSSGLSPVAIEEIRELLTTVASSGTAMLLVEQNVKLVQALCHQAWVLTHGSVKDSGPVAELLEGARVADAYLGGLDVIEGAAPIVREPLPTDQLGKPTTQPQQPSHDMRERTMLDEEWTFTGTRTPIAARRWRDPDAAPSYIALLAHGICEHVGRYVDVAAALVADGGVVYGLDHIGHGKSGGQRAVIEDFEDTVDDLHQLDAGARSDWPDLPVVLIGHSMGGMIAARYAQRHGESLAALVLSAPLVGEVPFLDFLLSPGAPLDTPLDVSLLSRDERVGASYAADPLVWRGGFDRRILEAMATMVATINAAGSVGRLPLLWLHGTDDGLVGIEGSRVGIDRLRGETFVKHEYAGARHEVFNETNSAEVLGDVTAFIGTVLGDG